MNSKQLNVFKIFLFIAGFLLVDAAFLVFNYPISSESISSAEKFFWIDIAICYLVFFIPFFFSSITLKNIDTKITSTVHIWISVIIFEIVAIAFAVLSLTEVVNIRISVIVELVVFFLAAIFVFFGYSAGNHIGNVQAKEQKSLSKIAELKSSFDMLNLKTDMWGDEFENQKKSVKKICDDIKYLSPVDSEASLKLEMKLMILANDIIESSLSSSELDVKIRELTNLVNQRKLLRK